MLITRDYLLRKPAGPSAPKQWFDTRVIPLAVDAAGAFEVALDRAAVRSGLRPSVILAGLAAAASLALFGLMRRRAAPA